METTTATKTTIKTKCNTCLHSRKKCFCRDYYQTFDTNINILNNFKEFTIKPMSVTTITTCYKLPHVDINFLKLEEQFKPIIFQSDHIRIILAKFSYKKGGKKSKIADINNQMYNSCTIESYFQENINNDNLIKISCKIFNRGTFTITGCKTLHQIMLFSKTIINYLKSLNKIFVYRTIHEYHNVKKVTIIKTKKKEKIVFENIPNIRIDLKQDNKSIYSVQIRNNNNNNNKYTYINEISTINDLDHSQKKTGKLINSTYIYPIDFNVITINTTTKLNVHFHLLKLNNLLQNNENYSIKNNGPIAQTVYYLDQKYPALRIKYVPNPNNIQEEHMIKKQTRKKYLKYPNELTISIFRTGSINYFGAINPNHIKEAHLFIIDLIKNNKEYICIKQTENNSYTNFYKNKSYSYSEILNNIHFI